jgi:hypothetical protein
MICCACILMINRSLQDACIVLQITCLCCSLLLLLLLLTLLVFAAHVSPLLPLTLRGIAFVLNSKCNSILVNEAVCRICVRVCNVYIVEIWLYFEACHIKHYTTMRSDNRYCIYTLALTRTHTYTLRSVMIFSIKCTLQPLV